MNNYRYRILTAEGKIKFTGTNFGSWFTLEKAKQLCNYQAGEMIYEYNHQGEKLWEVL